jgi:hypothetical protein
MGTGTHSLNGSIFDSALLYGWYRVSSRFSMVAAVDKSQVISSKVGVKHVYYF